MNILIVDAHPEPRSFNGAMKDLAVQTLGGLGHSVTVSDLYAMGWNAVAGPADISGSPSDTSRFSIARKQTLAMENGTIAADIAAEQAKLVAADLLISQFPVWWFGMPAILKDWADRVLARGFAYLPGRGDNSTCAAQLEACRQHLLSLDQTAPLFFHLSEDYGPNERLKPGVSARSSVQRNV